MAGAIGNYAGDITQIYYVADVITDKSEANLAAAILPANLIGFVTEIGEIDSEATNIEYAIAGEEYSSSIPGQRSPGTYDFSVAADWSNTLHKTLAADLGKVTHTFIIVINQATDNQTFIAFDGRLGNSTISGGVGEVGTINFSIYRQGGRTIVDKA